METEKLTLADCFKYPNAKIIKHNGDKIKDVLQLIIWALTKNLLVEFALKDFNCKLILRDISELTEEEKIHIERFIPKKFIDYTIAGIIRECSSSKLIELVDYLRSKDIDIDGYITSGKAVKE